MENTNTEYQSKYDWALFAFRRVICEWWWPAEKPDFMSHSELFGNTEEFLEKIDYRCVRKPHGGDIVAFQSRGTWNGWVIHFGTYDWGQVISKLPNMPVTRDSVEHTSELWGENVLFFQRICNPQILIFNELPFHHSINQKETCRNG